MMLLTHPQRRALWRLAGHKYAWSYCNGHVERRSMEALTRRGLAETFDYGVKYQLTDAGIAEVAKRWPNCPAVLGTYDEPADGWSKMHDDARRTAA
jgi:hypothetical protein